MTRIFEDAYYTADTHPQDARVEVTRSSAPFAEMQSLLQAADQLIHAIDEAKASGYTLLLDSRAAPVAPEGKYRDAFFMVTRNLTARFHRVAVILKSAETIENAKKKARAEVDFFCSLEEAREHLNKFAHETK